MNQNLKKDYTLEKNYRLLSQQFGKLISFGRRSSSAERKSIRVLKNSAHRKTTSNSKRILLSNNLRLFENNSAVNLTKNMSDDDIRKLFDELIRLDPDNERYYEITANRIRNHTQAIKYLELAIGRFPNDAYIINKLIDRILDYCADECSAENLNQYLSRVEELLGKSLTLLPSADNDAYIYKSRYLTIRYNNNRQELDSKKKELLETIKNIAPYHPNTLDLIHRIDSKSLSEQYFRDAIDYYKKADYNRNVERCYGRYIDWECDNGNFDKVLELFAEFETDYVGSDNYKYLKARVLMENEYFEDALLLFNEIPESKDSIRRKLTILTILGRENEADMVYETSEYKEDLKPHYLSLKDRYDEEKQYYEILLKEKGRLAISDAISYAYVLLQCEDYATVQKLLKPYYDNPVLAEGAVVVNYLFARKKMKEDVDNKLKSKILENKFIDYSDFEKLGAYCVLKDKYNSYTYLQKVIKKEPMQKYTISKWPVLAPFRHDEKFEKLLKPNHKRL